MKRKLKSPKIKKESEIIVDILGGNKETKMINDMMHTADMFEKGKQFAIHESLVVRGAPDLSKLCERIADAWKEAGGYIVFAGIRTINGKRAKRSYSYFMEDVHSISMRQKTLGWALFKDILSQLGYEAEVDKNMRAIKII